MKTIYLFRHSMPEKNCEYENGMIPLSEEGKILAAKLRKKLNLDELCIGKAYSSPYYRALQTANILADNTICDTRLRERKIGKKESFSIETWKKQYEDLNYKNNQGESLHETGERINSVIDEILKEMQENDTVLVVSHAAAICSYLFRFCQIDVIDVLKKTRRIVFKGKCILEGAIATPSVFILKYERDEIFDISYVK